MGRNHVRLGVWALALLTCFVVLGEHPALASNNLPRVEGSGWFNIFVAFGAPDNSAEVKFGVTAKYKDSGIVEGRFEYFNRFTMFKGHGSITSVMPLPPSSSPCPPPGPFAGTGGPSPNASMVRLIGACDGDDGGNCTFQMDVVDDDTPGHGPDWVCNPRVTGTDKDGHSEANSDGGAPLNHGHVEIKNYQP